MSKLLVSVHDYEREAQRRLPKAILDYCQSGALDEVTLKENKEAMNRWYIRPRFMQDVSQRSLATTLLGHKVTVPFGVAPTGMQQMAHPGGEVATAQAAGWIGAPFTLSTASTTSLEEVAKAASNTLRLFQLYIYKDRELTASLVRRAEAAGFSALVLTVDVPYVGIRRADVRNQFTLPPHLRLANFQSAEVSGASIYTSDGCSGISKYVASMFDSSLTWDDVAWLKSITKLPVVLKGILTREDAVLGMEAGAAAIWVSNHGARQLDGVAPTMEALPEVVEAVGGRCEVYVDGGFSQGANIFKALALGANMVFMGRPLLWGLACGGEDGAWSVLDTVRTKLESTMALSGCPTVPDITRAMVMRHDTRAHL
ncbi:peroxisomal (S)-2-hydroxy-acid oxidase GLO3-like isoform X2 [Portunus trituberculatus]|uniref:peroxisomal (S)-2-hydroxy-acid oxidase GLO3-like isoform X2 n=1 Tax=Portunus trituberculatus TaxID=210409 RepID=UPI001E1CE307|nr:peroxisomal (S)-2-hydroxy-acid oxidase GLO3-like isoform X2 [Portunus trituberculatus]